MLMIYLKNILISLNKIQVHNDKFIECIYKLIINANQY